MNVLDIARALFFILIAMIWGAWDWVMWQWNETSADEQIRFMAGAIVVGTLIAAHIFGPWIVQLFM